MAMFATLANAWFGLVFRRKKVNRQSSLQQGLSKCLTTWQLIHLGVGATLGAGTYVVTGQVAAKMAGPAVVISFTIAAITSLLSGLCYAEFGSRVPQTTGSAYTYSYVTIGEIWAFFIGWNLVLEYMIGTAADAAALSGSFDYAIGYRVREWTQENIGSFNSEYLGDFPDILSFVFTIAVTIVLAFGVRESAVFTVTFNFFNISVVAFIIITGIFYIDFDNWTKGDGFFPYGASGVLSGAATCFYAFVGFDIIATTGEEAKNPAKSIPIAIVASLVIIFLCYFGVSSVITLIVPYSKLDKHSPIPGAFSQRGLGWANYIISVGAICGLSSSLLGNLFPLPRIIYAMAKDGLLFKMFTKINKKTEVPVNATIYPGILTALFAFFFDLEELVEMMSIGTLLAYTLVSLCVLILRYQPDSYCSYESQPFVNKNNDSETDDGENTSSTIFMNDISSIKTINNINKADEPNNPLITNKEELKESLLPNSEEKVPINKKINAVKEADLPTEFSGRVVSCMCLCLFVWFFAFNSTLLFAFDQIYNKQAWAIFLLAFFGVLILISIGLIYSMPQSQTKYSFMCPCVPALPIIAIYANTFLMLKLSKITWIRFTVWMVIGVAIYLFYGTRNSKVDVNNEHTDEST
ncbi:high affinity cationic amino acid transporter 1 [Hydra vulgaris]|uniref:High affinity cationic amino acid transporter 1 n=1 Tax=Hydra vulgaris TaxID=6087 RepID=A0ABM4C110_HYDVU